MKYLIIDDHPLVLDALAAELSAENQCLLARSLGDGLALVKKYPDIDLIIFDLGLPDGRGLEGFMQLRVAAQSMPVLVLSGTTDRAEIEQVLKLGAGGFVSKTTPTAVLKQAIQLVLKGGVYLPPEMVSWREKASQYPKDPEEVAVDLTPREKEIVPLLVLGLSNKVIARQLGLSENTVRAHVASILKKMNLDGRGQVASKLLFGAA